MAASGRGGGRGGARAGEEMKSTRVMNERYDEAVELSDSGLDESIDTHAQSMSMSASPQKTAGSPPARRRAEKGASDSESDDSPPRGGPEDDDSYDNEDELRGAKKDTKAPTATTSSTAPARGAAALAPAAAPARAGSGGGGGSGGGSGGGRPGAPAPAPAPAASGGARGGASGGAGGGGGAGGSAAAGRAGATSRGDGRVQGSMKADGDGDGDTGSDSSRTASDDEGEDSGSASRSMSSPPRPPGAYNPRDFAGLEVPQDVRDLFDHITRYKPSDIELETKLKCFIPDYVPAIGEIDAFLKPERPDGVPEELGLKKLDEPAPHQSDPTVLDLQLRALSKKSNLEPVVVRSIENADKNPREVGRWITSIEDLHRTKPPPQVHYSRAMPDIESLMQEWPEEFEDLLRRVKLPPAEMDLSLPEYARVICNLFDIPVYDNTAQSLHVLFTLFSEFKANQHFAGGVAAGVDEGAGGASGGTGSDAGFDA